MKVYRIEHRENGRGPYIAGVNLGPTGGAWTYTTWAYLEQAYNLFGRERTHWGCQSIADLFHYFGDLHKGNPVFHCTVWEAPLGRYVIANEQVLFDRENSILLETIELSDLVKP